jgi:hypothetical protein
MDLWALNISLIFWIIVVGIFLHCKGLLIPLLAGIGVDMGVML